MTNQNPITPPPELVAKWASSMCGYYEAARWGADQELEACCLWMERNYNYPRAGHPLRLARRPKPPSLKEQALHELNDVYNRDKIDDSTYDTICRALEALDD